MPLVPFLKTALKAPNSMVSRDSFLYVQMCVPSLQDFTPLSILLSVLIKKPRVIITRVAMEVPHIADNEAIMKCM